MSDTLTAGPSAQLVPASPAEQATITNAGSALVYYSKNASVSALSNEGSIASGASLTIYAPRWFITEASQAGARLIVSHTPDEQTDPATQAELEALQASSGVALEALQVSTTAGLEELKIELEAAMGEAGGAVNLGFNPLAYGATGDVVKLTDGAMTLASKVLTSAHTFKQEDVGKEIEVEGAGPGSGLPLVTTIASVVAGVATLTRAAESSVSGKGVVFGTDDTKGVQATINAANEAYVSTGVPQEVTFPNGSYLLSYANGTTQSTQEVCLVLKSGVILSGPGARLMTMSPVATIVTEDLSIPVTNGTLKVASTTGFSETNKNIACSIATFGTVGSAWSAKTATSFTITESSTTTIKAGNICCQNRNRSMVATPKETTAEFFKVRGLLLDGRTVSAVGGGFPEENQHCIQIWAAKNFELDHLEVKRFAGKAFFIQGASEILSNFSVHHNDVHHLYANVMRITAPGSDWAVTDNYFHDCAREELGGVETFITSTSLLLKRGRFCDNIVENWGVVDLSGTDILCENNLIRVSVENVPGIRILTLDKSTISGNVVDMSQMETEELATCLINESTVTDTQITGNTFIGAAGKGNKLVQLQFTCERVSFNNNTVIGTAENQSVSVSSATIKGFVASGNVFKLAGGTGTVTMKSTRGAITGNHVYNGKSLVDGSDLTVTGNHFYSLEGKGETLRITAPGCTISSNRLIGANGSSGVLRLSNAAKDCVVTGNVIEATENSAAWIAEEAECDRNLIEGNHLIATGTGSTVVQKGPNTMVRNNHGTDGANLYIPRRTVAADYTVLNVDDTVAVTSTAAERTMTLPEAAKVPKGKRYTIKDESGGAATKNIKVVPKTPASEKIDGAEVQTISANYGTVIVYSNQTNWFTV